MGGDSGVPTGRWEQVLRTAEQWAGRPLVLLELRLGESRKQAEWPRLETLEHRLEHAGVTITATSLAREMPTVLGFPA